jgi:1-acyl-sn-glycerol-3-phosphate acyltransferase
VTTRQVLLDPPKPRAGQVSRWPVLQAVGYTLNISTRFLLSMAAGNGTVARYDQLIEWYWRKILTAGQLSLVVHGREHFTRGGAHVVMSNHSSLLDIPLMMASVPGSVRFVTKEELTRIPIWGHALLASGYIPISRNNRERAIQQLEKAKVVLRQGLNVWVSPEGTRGRTGELGPFKKGGFHTALGLGVPVVPAWIEGAFGIIPPRQFGVTFGGSATVRFGPPIETEGRSKEDLAPLMDEVRRAMVALSGRPDATAPALAADTAPASLVADAVTGA